MQVTVKSTSGQVEVVINHKKLTPRAAIAARDVAFGLGASASVTDGKTTYRVTGVGQSAKARKTKNQTNTEGAYK